MLFGISKISISEDALFMKHMLLYFFEVATTRFMDNVKEKASKRSSTAEENHPNLRKGLTTQFSRQLHLHFQCPDNDPAFHITNLGHQACDISPYV